MAQFRMVWASSMPGCTSKDTRKASRCFDQYGYSDSRAKKRVLKKSHTSTKLPKPIFILWAKLDSLSNVLISN